MNYIYFSASGTTKKVVSILSEAIKGNSVTYDLLKDPPDETVTFAHEDAAVFAFPVFGGRIPQICPGMLEKFKGNATAAIAIVVYGNRAYDDALLELKDILSERGFVTVAAAAFIAAHSIFPEVAAGRPDEADRQKILSFGLACMEKLASRKDLESVSVKGNHPYINAGPVAVHPSGDKNCNGCGACANICPVKAIPADTPQKTDNQKCISCTACIAACPQHARGFHIPVIYPLAAKAFAKNNRARKEPEIFL